MNVIDLEILIPASPEFIWRFMGDLSAIPQWYEEVVSVSFLSTQREGRGTRWRHSTVKGSDVIVEVSAWYDTLGYEYRIVDGTTFGENQGRIRLHEVTDGTLVRWTFQYESGGVLGGIRNTMRLKRSTTNQIQDSLRNLHQLIMQESGGISTHEAKASMQDAPDVSERLSYQPRHPSTFQEVAAEDGADDDTSLSERLPLFYDTEPETEVLPQAAETDTRPNPVVLGMGDDLIADSEPERELEDTQPVEVATLLAEIPPPEPHDLEPEPAPPIPEQPAQESIEESELSSPSVAPRSPDDASHLSVFEIFGLQKPSETRAKEAPATEIEGAGFEAINDEDAPQSGLDDAAVIESVSDQPPADDLGQAEIQRAGSATISGWRRNARRKIARIRSHT